jgi:hypothetical protein
MVADVSLQVVPSTLLVADLTAGSTDGQKSAQRLDASQSLLEFLDQALALGFRRSSFSNVADDDAGPGIAFRTPENHGRNFDRKKRAVFRRALSSPWVLPVRCRSSTKKGKPRIGGIDQSLPAFLQNLLARASQNSAGGGFASIIEPSGAVRIKPSRLF